MHLVLHLLGLSFSVAVLVKSADWFTEAAVDFARRFHVPEIVVGATIVSLATTLPEFAVSFTAALGGHVDMAVGNAVGSTICNIGLILGLCALIAPMGIVRAGFLASGFELLVLSATFSVLGYAFPEGSRWTGLVLIGCFLLYVILKVRTSFAHRHAALAADEDDGHARLPLTKSALFFVGGAGGVVGGSRLMVFCGEHLARALGVSELVISLTFMAIGTSTPELVVSLTGIVKKRRALSIGNVIGANILNLAWVIGACSLATELPFKRQVRFFDLPVMMLLTLLLLVFGITGHRLSRWEGTVLLGIYIAYVASVFLMFGAGN